MTQRPLLTGQSPGPNTRPELPLFCLPKTSAGGRLQELTGLTRGRYLAGFQRMNLLYEHPGRHKRDDKFPVREARVAANAVKPLLEGRRVIFIGRKVGDAFGYGSQVAPWHEWGYCPKWSFTYACVPHPSGRNHWYNNQLNRDVASEFWRVLIEAHPQFFRATLLPRDYTKDRLERRLIERETDAQGLSAT